MTNYEIQEYQLKIESLKEQFMMANEKIKQLQKEMAELKAQMPWGDDQKTD